MKVDDVDEEGDDDNDEDDDKRFHDADNQLLVSFIVS